MTIVGVQLIDRLGRRRLMLIGAAGMCFCEYIVAIVGITVGQQAADGSVNLTAQHVLIALVCLYIAFFATSWGPVAWVVTGEIFVSFSPRQCPDEMCQLTRYIHPAPSHPRQGDVTQCCQQLAVEFRYWICHALPRRPLYDWRECCKGCRPRCQSVLHLGIDLLGLLPLCILLHS